MNKATAVRGEGEFRGSSRFRVVSRLGVGGCGQVYEALDVESNSRVALKTLRDATPDMLRVLKHEFRAVQDIQHPNLVSLGELLEEDGQWFFTMELVDGVDFLQYVSRGHARTSPRTPTTSQVQPAAHAGDAGPPSIAAGPRSGPLFDESRLRDALRQLVLGLRALHGAGKVHRDVKPSNILVAEGGRLVLLDFGVVRDRDRRAAFAEDEFVGTPAYMAPEQCDSADVGPAADWYAVGALLYQALTGGKLPFTGAPLEILQRKLVEPPRPLREVTPFAPDDLATLCMELLAMDPAERPDGAEIARRLGLEDDAHDRGPTTSRDVFVGREDELKVLLSAFQRMKAGATEVVFVFGESGVGKTALMRKFTESARGQDEDVLLLRGRCYERESLPYKAVDDVVDQLAALLGQLEPSEAQELLPEDIGVLCRGFPVLKTAAERANGSVPEVDVVNPREQRSRLFFALRELLVRVGRRSPVVLTIDDLHWADEDSVRLLVELVRPPEAPRILVVGTLRSETEVRANARRVADELSLSMGRTHTIHLEKLPFARAEELARSLADDAEAAALSTSELAHIAAEAKGHPLFIAELVRRRASFGEGESLARLDDVLWDRVTRLDPVAKRFLEAVAVAGVPLPQHTLASAAGMGPGELLAVTSTLRGAHLVRAHGARLDDVVEPYHDRVRESVLARIQPDERSAIHARLAIAAEQRKNPDPEFLLLQWEGAGNKKRAAEYALLAAERAAATLAFERAAQLYQRALDYGAGNETERREIQQKLADALTNAGREAEAANVRLALAGNATTIEAYDLKRQAAEQLLQSGHFELGKTLLREVLVRVRERYPVSPLGVMFWLLVVRAMLRLRGVRVAPSKAGSLDATTLLRMEALWSAGAGLSMTDNVRGAYFQTKNLLLSMAVGDVRRAARALAMEVCFRSASGTKGKERTLVLLAEARRLAELVGTPDALGLADTARGYVYYFLGDWATSVDAFVRAETLYCDRCVGVAWQLGSTRTMLYRALGLAGRVEELRRRFPPVLRDAEQRGDRNTELNVTLSAAVVVGLADDAVADAERRLQDVKRYLAPGAFLVQHYYCMLGEMQIALYAGKPAVARACLEEALPRARRSLLMRIASFRAQTADIRARLAVALAMEAKDAAEKQRWLVEAEQQRVILGSIATAWAPAAADLAGACIHAARGEREASLEALRAALNNVERAGLAMHAAAARRRLGEALGGSEGRELLAEAERYEASQRIVRPDAIARLLLPGFPSAPSLGAG